MGRRKMVQYCLILMISSIVFVGCNPSMPNKDGYIILGEEVKAPYGYTDYMNRNKPIKD